MWTFFLIWTYFTPIKNQLMILILKKLSLKRFATLQLSLHKLAILYYLTARQFIVNRADLQQSLNGNFIPFIPVPRNGKFGWYEKFKQHNFLLQESPTKIILIGDSLISNWSRYPDVWKNYFSIHKTLNFGIQGDKI